MAGGPLNNTDRANIDKALATLNVLPAEMDKAERAGVDVTEYRERANQLYDRLIAIRQEYFGTPPPGRGIPSS